MEKMIECKINVIAPPDGWECVGFGAAVPGETKHYANYNGDDMWVDTEFALRPKQIIARRRQSLADWANGQRLFQALAEMRKADSIDTSVVGCAGDAWWKLFCNGFSAGKMKLGLPPFSGAIKLANGKWVDA